MLDEFVREGISSGFSKDNINLWAREAAQSMMNEDVDLNEKIAEIAGKNNLNKEQIQRVVEATNLTVDSYKKGSDFNLAKTASVIAIIKKPIEGSSSLDDYLCPPSGKPVGPDIKELFGVKELQPTESIPQVKEIKIRIIKTANAKKELEGHLMNLERRLNNEEKEIVKVAKQCVMGDHEDINELYDLAIRAGYEKTAKKMFPIINHVLVGQHVLEKTAFRIEDNMISKDMDKQGIPDIKIINGNHALLKRFQTFEKICDDIVHARKAIVVCNDKIEKLREKSERVS